MKRVLSLCGGGSSGYMTACFITKIEKEIGCSILDKTDLIAGVSTGSIISALLQKGHSGLEIKSLYKEFFQKVFGDENKRMLMMTLWKPLYKAHSLQEALVEVLGDMAMCEAKVPFMAHALSLGKPELKPKFWKSWCHGDEDVKIRDVVMASSSAPMAFKPHEIDGKYYQDGGIVLNDPTLATYAETKVLGWSNVKFLTFQTDYHEGFDNPSKIKGLIKLAPKLLSMAIDSGEASNEYMSRNILGDNYLNLKPKIYLPIDSGNWLAMENAAERLWENKKQEVIDFFKET